MRQQHAQRDRVLRSSQQMERRSKGANFAASDRNRQSLHWRRQQNQHRIRFQQLQRRHVARNRGQRPPSAAVRPPPPGAVKVTPLPAQPAPPPAAAAQPPAAVAPLPPALTPPPAQPAPPPPAAVKPPPARRLGPGQFTQAQLQQQRALKRRQNNENANLERSTRGARKSRNPFKKRKAKKRYRRNLRQQQANHQNQMRQLKNRHSAENKNR